MWHSWMPSPPGMPGTYVSARPADCWLADELYASMTARPAGGMHQYATHVCSMMLDLLLASQMPASDLPAGWPATSQVQSHSLRHTCLLQKAEVKAWAAETCAAFLCWRVALLCQHCNARPARIPALSKAAGCMQSASSMTRTAIKALPSVTCPRRGLSAFVLQDLHTCMLLEQVRGDLRPLMLFLSCPWPPGSKALPEVVELRPAAQYVHSLGHTAAAGCHQAPAHELRYKLLAELAA